MKEKAQKRKVAQKSEKTSDENEKEEASGNTHTHTHECPNIVLKQLSNVFTYESTMSMLV